MAVIVTHDPSGLYKPGAEFRVVDWATTHQLGNWPPGIRFRVEQRDGTYRAKVIGKLMIREDGAKLITRAGGRYVWLG